MSKYTMNNILVSLRQYSLSFIFLNVIAAIFGYVIYPSISNKYSVPINVCFSCGNINYFRFFGMELGIIIVGTAIGLLASLGLIRLIETSEFDNIFRLLSNPFVNLLFFFLPLWVFLVQLNKGEILIYDGTVDQTLGRFFIYLIFVVFNYTFFVLINERGKYLEDPKAYQPLLILARKAPHVINYWIVVSVLLNLPFTGKFFLYDSIFALTNTFVLDGLRPISLQGGILAFSLLILILQILYSTIHYLVYKEERPYISSPAVFANNISKIKKPVFYLVLLLLLVVFLVQIIFIALGINAQFQGSILFLDNPFLTNFERINLPPSLNHLFGTDRNGIDILSQTLFAMSSFVLFIYIFSLIQFRIAMDFENITSNNVKTSTKLELLQIIGNVPAIPVLILIATSLKYASTSIIFYLILTASISLICWAKVADLLERNGVSNNKERLSYFTHPIILFTIASFMLDLTILSILTMNSGLLTFGNLLQGTIFNQPLFNWWGWILPLLFLLLMLSFLRSSRIKI